MIFIYYILLGIVQGIVEALPISSSGHLLVFNNLLTNYLGFKNVALSNTELLAIITNFGSLIAVIILYRNKIISILKDFFGYFKTKSKKQEIEAKHQQELQDRKELLKNLDMVKSGDNYNRKIDFEYY